MFLGGEGVNLQRFVNLCLLFWFTLVELLHSTLHCVISWPFCRMLWIFPSKSWSLAQHKAAETSTAGEFIGCSSAKLLVVWCMFALMNVFLVFQRRSYQLLPFTLLQENEFLSLYPSQHNLITTIMSCLVRKSLISVKMLQMRDTLIVVIRSWWKSYAKQYSWKEVILWLICSVEHNISHF